MLELERSLPSEQTHYSKCLFGRMNYKTSPSLAGEDNKKTSEMVGLMVAPIHPLGARDTPTAETGGVRKCEPFRVGWLQTAPEIFGVQQRAMRPYEIHRENLQRPVSVLKQASFIS